VTAGRPDARGRVPGSPDLPGDGLAARWPTYGYRRLTAMLRREGWSVNGKLMRTIREEEIDLIEYRDFADAYGQLGRFLDEVNNRKRIHSGLEYLTAREFEPRWLRGRNATAIH
jgi:transposase InsO family protein